MKTQTLYIEEYDWIVKVFYDTRSEDVEEVMDALISVGCPPKSLKRSYENIISNKPNNGLTFSSNYNRESVMSIGHTDSLAQFLNSFAHETFHLVKHICLAYDIDPFGEPAAYLAGDIAEQMHPLLEQYMCSCKKCKH